MVAASLGILFVVGMFILVELVNSGLEHATERLTNRLGARVLGIVTLGRFPKTRDGTFADIVAFLVGLSMLVVGAACLLAVVAALWPG